MTDARPAAEIIRSAIAVLARDAGAPFTARPVIRSEPAGPSQPEPEPLTAIRAATALRHAATRAAADYARYAREDGCSLADIGEAMGFADRPSLRVTDAVVAERAFAAVASDLGRGLSFAWTCPSCLGVIMDYGPEAGRAEDAERGHAGGCARLAASRAWEDSDG